MMSDLDRFMQETDEQVYNRYLNQRDEKDIHILFERYKESHILFINSLVHNIDDAEELMIDTFAQIVAGPTMFSERSSFKTWLFSVGRNLTLMRLRRLSREFAIDVEDMIASEDLEFDILKNERNRQLYSALEKLKPQYREILILVYFEDMTHEEAGRVMHKNRKQIYNLVQRGQKALKDQLERMGFNNEGY